MNLGRLIVPLGITTYTLLAITVLSGLFRINLKYHKYLAFTTLLLATIHASIVIYLRFFR